MFFRIREIANQVATNMEVARRTTNVANNLLRRLYSIGFLARLILDHQSVGLHNMVQRHTGFTDFASM